MLALLPVDLRGQSLSLSTGLTGSGPAFQGYYFDVSAAKNLVVQSFDVEVDGQPMFPAVNFIVMEVWTTKDGGPVAGHQDEPEDWELIGITPEFPAPLAGSFMPLGLQLDEFIPAGETRGFYLVRTELYSRLHGVPSPLGTTLASNSDLTITSDSGTSFYFAREQIYVGLGAPSLQVHYDLHPVNPVDLRVAGFTAPVSSPGCQLLGMESVSIDLQNVGSSSLAPGTNITLALSVDGGPNTIAFETLAQALAPGGTTSFTFPAPVDLSALGGHQLDVTATVLGDGFPGNDTASMTIHSGGAGRVTTLPWIEDFESIAIGTRLGLPQGWEQDWNDASGLAADWWLSRGPDSIASFKDHTHDTNKLGAFAVASDLGEFLQVNLRSPCIDLNSSSNPQLSLWFNSRSAGAPFGSKLFVDVIEHPSGTIHPSIMGPLSHLFREWRYQSVSLTQFAGKVIQLQFRAVTSTGSTNLHIGLDDIRVFNAVPTPGQNEQPGLATLTIGDARNANGAPQYVQTGGPYFVGLDVGDPLLFEFEGQPNQPVIFLSGNLNPQAATFPNIGSMDIGSLPDPLTGIPGGLLVLADGTSLFGVFSPFFVTNSSGSLVLGLTMPSASPGPITTFQAAFLTDGSNGSWVALSNAIQLSTN